MQSTAVEYITSVHDLKAFNASITPTPISQQGCDTSNRVPHMPSLSRVAPACLPVFPSPAQVHLLASPVPSTSPTEHLAFPSNHLPGGKYNTPLCITYSASSTESVSSVDPSPTAPKSRMLAVTGALGMGTSLPMYPVGACREGPQEGNTALNFPVLSYCLSAELSTPTPPSLLFLLAAGRG